MTSKEEHITNSFAYLVPLGPQYILPFITLPIFTRILTVEDYGILALAQIYASVVMGIADVGLTNVFNRNFFQYDQQGSSKLLYSILLFVIVNFLVCLLFTFVFKDFFSRWLIGSAHHSRILLWVLCSVAIARFKGYLLLFLRNSENAKDYARYTICDSILASGFSLVLVALISTGIIGIVWGQLLASLIIFSVLIMKCVFVVPLSFSWDMLKSSLRISYPLTLSILSKVIAGKFDKYMIGLMVSTGGVGFYSIGQKVATVVFGFMTAIQNVYFPQVYKKMFGGEEKGGELIGRYLTPFAYVSIGGALIVAMFSEELFWFLTPESYHGAINIVTVLCMFYGSMFFGKQPQLIFAKKTGIVSVLTFVNIGLNVGLNIPFIIKWGAIGAAWATFLAGLIIGIIHFAFSQHYYEIKWEYRKIGTMYLIFFMSSMVILLLRDSMIDYLIRLLVKVVFVGVYSYIGYRIGIVTSGNMLSVRNVALTTFRRMGLKPS